MSSLARSGAVRRRLAGARRLLASLALVLGVVGSAWGQAYTSQAAGNWNTSTTWSPNGVPGSGDTVSIGHDITLVQAQSVDGITFTGSNTISGAFTLTLGGSATVTVNTGITGNITTSVIGGTAGLTKAGTGVLALSALNTYSGTTLVSAGTLRISGANGAINLSTQVTVSDGATLDVDSTSTSADRFANGGTITMNGGTFSWTGAAAVLSETIGTLAFSAKHSYVVFTGNSAVNTVTLNANTAALTRTNNATMEFQRSNAFLKASLTAAAIQRWTSVLQNGYQVCGTYDATNGLIQATSSVYVSNQAVSTNYNWGTAATWTTNPGTFPGAGDAAVITGAGYVIMLNSSGSSVNESCKSLFFSNSSGGSNGAMTKFIGGNVYVNTSTPCSDSSTYDFGSAEGVFICTGTSTLTQYYPAFANATAITKSGPGTLVLGTGNGAATWTSPVNVVQGTLKLVAQANSPLGSNAGGTTVYDGGCVDFNGCTPGTEPFTISGTGVSGAGAFNDSNASACACAGAVTLAADSTIGVSNASGQLTISGAIGGAYSLTKVGAGLLILSNTGNNWSGGSLTISNGTLRVAGNTAIPDACAVTTANLAAAVLDLNGTTETIGSLAGGGNLGGNVTLGAGTLTIGGSATTTYDGVISGSGGALTVSGSGALTLTRASSYTGTTTIGSGTLYVNANNSSSAVSLNSTGLLGGTGRVGAISSTAGCNGGIVEPGTAAAKGTLIAGSTNLSLGTNATIKVRVAAFTTAGTDYDKLDLATAGGSLTLGGSSKLIVDLSGVAAAGTASGVITCSSRSGTFASVATTNAPAGYAVTVVYNATSVDVIVDSGASTTWLGTTSAAWATSANWGNGVPDSAHLAHYVAAYSNPCTVGSGAYVLGVTVDSGYASTVTQGAGFPLHCGASGFVMSGGTWTCNDTLFTPIFTQTGGTFGGTSTVYLIGPSGGTLSATSTLNNLEVEGLDTGLVGYWKLDETSGTVAYDAIGNSNGTYTFGSGGSAAPVTEGTIKPTLVFADPASRAYSNANRSLVSVPDVAAQRASTALTYAAWVRPNSIANQQYPIAKTSGNSGEFLQITSAGNFYSNLGDGSARQQTSPAAAMTLTGSWQHVAGTWDGATNSSYRNGVLRGTVAAATIGSTSGVNLFLGGDNGANSVDGYLDDCRIYSRALSEAEVENLSNGLGGDASQATTFTLASNVTINGNLKLYCGTLALGTATLSVNGSCTLYGQVSASSGVLALTGTGAGKTLRCGEARIPSLTVNSSDGTGVWTLQDRLNVSGTLSIAAGQLDTGSNYTIRCGALNQTGAATTLVPHASAVVVESLAGGAIKASTTLSSLRVESPIDSGLIGYWKFDTQSGLTQYDYSGNGHTATAQGAAMHSTTTPTPVATVFENGGSASFDGVNDYMTVANSTGMNGSQITIAAWVKPSSVSAIDHDIVSKWGVNGNYGYNLRIGFGGGLVGDISTNGSNDSATAGATALSTGTWYHVAMTYDGAALKLWLNGSLDGATQMSGSIFASTDAVTIGHMDPAFQAGRWYAGLLDDVRIYNRALSPSEIRNLANGRYAEAGLDLAAYWKFDEQSGTAATDSSGYGLSATLSSSSMWTASAPSVSFTDAGGVATNGSTTYVTLPSSTSLNVPAGCGLTVSGWLKTTENYGTALSMRNAANGNSVIDVFVGFNATADNPGKLEMYMRDDDNSTDGGAGMVGGIVNDGAWHHFALVRETGGHLLLYQDGTLRATSSFAYPGPITTDMRYIGVEQRWATIELWATADQEWFAGSVDDVRFYKRQLSATEIAALAAGSYRTGTYALSAALATTTLGIDAGGFDANGFATTASGAFALRDGMGTYLAGSATQTFGGGFTMSGGTFVGGSGTVAVTGDFTMAPTSDTNGGMPQSGGSFTAPSGTMTVTGSIAMGAGTFAPNGGTVQLTGGSAGKTLSGITASGGGLYTSFVGNDLRSVSQDDWRMTQAITGQRIDTTVAWPGDAWGTAIERQAYGATNSDANWDAFSVQWDGWITVPVDNTTIVTRSDDSSRVWLDMNNDGVVQTGEWGSNAWGNGQGPITRVIQYNVPKGTYRLRMQYEEGVGGDTAYLAWSDSSHSAGTTPDGDYIVPSTYLTPARGGGLVFNNLQVTGAGTWTVNDPIYATGSITCSAGTLVQGSGAHIDASGGWTQNGGTFTGSGASTVNDNVTIGGDFSCTSGTFTCTKGSFNVGGNFSVSGGTFAHNAGTVELRPSGAKTITCTQTLNHLRLNDGLVAYWNFDEASSPALDLTGRGHDATWNGAPTPSTTNLPAIDVADPRSMATNGSSQFLTPARQTEFILPQFTLAGWAYVTSSSGWPNYGDIFNRQGAGNYNQGAGTGQGQSGYGLEMFNGGWRCYAMINGVFKDAESAALTMDVWHHVAATCDGSAIKLYIDGVLVTTTAITATAQDFMGLNVAIGRNEWGQYSLSTTGAGVPGAIEELRIYNRALSAAEIDMLAGGHDPGATLNTVQLGSSLTLAGDMVLLSGTLDASPGYDIAVGGSWTNRGGAFTRGTRTVTLNGSGSSTIRCGSQPFYNLTLSGSGTYTGTDPIRVRGALLQSSGTFVAPSSRLVCDGNLTVSGGTFTHNSGTVVMRSSSASTLTCTQAFNNLAFSDGLVAHWRCEEASSPSLDGSGYGLSGIWTNGATCDAVVKPTLFSDNARSLSFDGVNDVVAVRDPGPTGDLEIANGSGLTIAVWAYANSIAGYHNVLCKSRSINDADSNYAMRVENGLLEFYQWHGTDWDVWVTSAAVVSAGGWHHLAFTTTLGTAASMVAYVDGQAVPGSWVYGNGNNAPALDNRPLWIGATADSSGNPSELWNGRLDDVRIYNRALAADEIARLASGRQPATGVATFTLGSNLTVAGDLTIGSGALDLNTRSVNVGGSWQCGGRVTAGTSTVTFNGSGVGNAILSGNQSLNNVAVTGTGTWTCSDWFRAGGTFTESAGTFAGNAKPVTIGGNLSASGGALIAPATEVLACGGNVTDAGGSTFQANAGAVEMTSTSAQSLNVTCIYNHLWIASGANSGMVARFRLDEAQAGIAVDDVSGIIARATNTPTPSTSTPTMWTRDPYCLDCSGATSGSDNDYLTLANSTTMDNLQNSSYSISAWFWPRVLPPGTGSANDAFYGIVMKAGHHSGLSYNSAGGFQMSHWLTGNVNAECITAQSYAVGQWYHLCGVVDVPGGTTKLYVNGVLAASATWAGGTATLAYGATPWRIGIADPAGATWMWPVNGLIDDVRFYSRTLGAQEALVLANNGFDPANGGATFTLAHAATIAGDVDLLGGTLAAGGLAINAAASWRNLVGTSGFTAGGDTVTLNGTSQQLYGSTTFANLTKSVASAATLTFPAYECQNVTGTLTLNGAAGQLLSIRSSVPGSMATINPTGTHVGTCHHLDVKDSRNFCMPIINPTNSVNSGDTKWWFGPGPGNGVLIANPPVE